MATSTLLVTALLAWILLVTCVLRTMSMARQADELADRHWEELARLHSPSGIAFFPTTDARIELELAISEALELERAAARRQAVRRRPLQRLTTSAI